MQFLRFIKFGLVGCAGIIIDFSITWACKEKLKWNKYLASSLGFSLAVVNNYLLNKYFTFQDRNTQLATQFLKFFVISIIGLALSNLFLYLLLKNAKLNFYLSKAIVIGLVFTWNFSANSLYTFNH